MKVKSSLFFGLALVVSVTFAQQGVTTPQKESRPTGFRFFNNHLTIKPYVSLTYTYDSNIDTTHHAEDDSIFAVTPGAEFAWRGEKWALTGSLWYRYRYYCEYNHDMGENSYGENLAYTYSSSEKNEKGWTLMLAERYGFYNQSDDLTSRNGRGVWRDRETFDAQGVLERRFTERWHADIQGQYTWIDYKNKTGHYAPLNGWSQYGGGVQAGYAASRWTDLLVAAGYSRYNQKTGSQTGLSRHYSSNSDAYSVMAGLGSHMTELITYRALMGASWFDYGNAGDTDCGWTYTLSANWRIHRQVQLSVMGSSYYQPSERYVGQAVKVYTLGGGISYLTLGDRLNLTANVSWRYEENIYSDAAYTRRQNYDESWLSARLGADYLVNRWMSVFANIMWEQEWCGNGNNDYDYDRFRGTLGVRFHY